MRVKHIPAPGGGYFGCYFCDKRNAWVRVKPINGGSFDSLFDAIRAAKHRVGNPFTMKAACPVPQNADLDELGVNKWRQRKAMEPAELQKAAFGTITVKGRSIQVEKKRKERRRGRTSV